MDQWREAAAEATALLACAHTSNQLAQHCVTLLPLPFDDAVRRNTSRPTSRARICACAVRQVRRVQAAPALVSRQDMWMAVAIHRCSRSSRVPCSVRGCSRARYDRMIPALRRVSACRGGGAISARVATRGVWQEAQAAAGAAVARADVVRLDRDACEG